MKNIILLLFAAGVVLSCKQEEYTGYLTHDGMEEVALITLSPNSPVLTADGRSELVFKVKPFMEVEHTRRVEYIVDNRSVVKDSTYAVIMAVRPDLIDPADITITASTGETLDGLTYKTSTGAGGEVTFTAKYKGLTSDPHTVKIVAPTAYDPVTIPVVFHLLPDTQDEELYATFGTEFFQHLLDRTNAVFGGKLGNDPAAADAWSCL